LVVLVVVVVVVVVVDIVVSQSMPRTTAHVSFLAGGGWLAGCLAVRPSSTTDRALDPQTATSIVCETRCLHVCMHVPGICEGLHT
jgi:hypothetical protein